MAIKIRRGENFFYAGVINLLDRKEKKRADEIYNYSKNILGDLTKKTKLHKEMNALVSWHRKGISINMIICKFKITESEKKYFWLMLYDVTETSIPERAKKFHIQNDFRTASILSKYPLKDLRSIGNWNLWREIIGSTKIGGDDRVAQWVADYIFKRKIKTRDQARPLLKAVRNRLKKIDTTILSDRELVSKLKEVLVG